MNDKLQRTTNFVIAALLGTIAGFAKVTWAFVYTKPITFLTFDLVIYSVCALLITLMNKEKKKIMVFVVFLLPSVLIVVKTAIDGIKRTSFKNLPIEWSITPLTIVLAAFIGYKLGTAMKTRRHA
jgi:hypothetical protein